MSKQSVLGNVTKQLLASRREEYDKAEERILQRNGIAAENEGMYNLERVTSVSQRGEEVTSMKLWKLVDEEQIIITGKINVTSERVGVEEYDHSHRAPEGGHNSSPI